MGPSVTNLQNTYSVPYWPKLKFLINLSVFCNIVDVKVILI